MGPPPDPESMAQMLENPQFQSTINEALQNPQMIDLMIQQNPMLRDLPGAREMFQSPDFRRMMTDPNSLRHMMQMQRAMGAAGLGQGGLGGPGGGGAFPAPGATNTTPEENRDAQNNDNASSNPIAPPINPFMGQNLGAGNPFAALFGGNPAGQTGAASTEAGATPSGDSGVGGQNAQNSPWPRNPFGGGLGGMGGLGGNPFSAEQNPFLRNPALMEQLMQSMGGQGGESGAGNPLASLLGGAGLGSPAPQDNRPPEERYAEQLGQLNDMGFFEFERNIEALRRSGGSVQGAVEYLLSYPS